MWSAFLLWIVKMLGARIITKEMILVILAYVFEKLYEATQLTATTMDDEALLSLDRAIDRDKLAQGVADTFRAM